jgi:hypothetical protein
MLAGARLRRSPAGCSPPRCQNRSLRPSHRMIPLRRSSRTAALSVQRDSPTSASAHSAQDGSRRSPVKVWKRFARRKRGRTLATRWPTTSLRGLWGTGPLQARILSLVCAATNRGAPECRALFVTDVARSPSPERAEPAFGAPAPPRSQPRRLRPSRTTTRSTTTFMRATHDARSRTDGSAPGKPARGPRTQSWRALKIRARIRARASSGNGAPVAGTAGTRRSGARSRRGRIARAHEAIAPRPGVV